MGYLEFLEAEFGKNWVISSRTPSVVRRYGSDVICLTTKRYAEAAAKYRRAYGDPHDAVRRELYAAFKAVVDKHAKPCFMGDPYTYEPEWERAIKALEAEANAK